MADEWSEWRGWNGGPCPVDRDVTVQTAWIDGDAMTDAARLFAWDTPRLVAYRVKRKPRVETVRQEMWAEASGPGNPSVYFYTFKHSGMARGFLVYETRDGIPDMTTLRWEDAE